MAWLGCGGSYADALQPLTVLRPVRVHAQIGNLFPPLELLRRIRSGSHPREQLLTLSNSGEPTFPHARSPQTIDVGIWLTEPDPREHQGNLRPSAREAVMRLIESVSAERFQYHAKAITFDPGPAFWYPYFGGNGRRLVFCRLVVRDFTAAESESG
jgi:hypothetical protein